MTTRFSFTMASLRALKAPLKGRLFVYDTKQPALAAQVTAAGAKTFYVYKKVKGKPVRILLGPFPDITVDLARELAVSKLDSIYRGIDLAQEKRVARQKGTTLEMAFTKMLEEWTKVRGRLRTIQTNQSRFKTCLSSLADRPLDSITKNDVVALHATLGVKGRTNANRAVQFLRAIYNYARKYMDYEGINPASAIELFKEEERDRFLQSDELPRFFAALASEENETFRDFFTMALLTGARKSNLLSMRWDDINLSSRTWVISGAEFKTGKPMIVILSPEAIEILERRPQVNEFVFPGSGKTGHITEPKFAWKKLLMRAGISNLRLHDLRRTLGSWQAGLGASLPIIGASLGHTRVETTKIYSRLQLDVVRASVDAAVKAITEAGQTSNKKGKKQA